MATLTDRRRVQRWLLSLLLRLQSVNDERRVASGERRAATSSFAHQTSGRVALVVCRNYNFLFYLFLILLTNTIAIMSVENAAEKLQELDARLAKLSKTEVCRNFLLAQCL